MAERTLRSIEGASGMESAPLTNLGQLPRAFPVHASRRSILQAGAIGLLGLGMADIPAARAFAARPAIVPNKSVIFVFLNGGIAHQDSFDLKPEAPDAVRGEFRPIATETAGIEICEHLPL